jgi:hypothetical protein
MSFCWREDSRVLVDTTLACLVGVNKPQSNQEALLKSHLVSQFGIISSELIPLVGSHLGLPSAARNIPFSQIFNYKELLLDALGRQQQFLSDTGVKLEAYYSSLPSGDFLDDKVFDEHLYSTLFGDDGGENSAVDYTSPASSIVSGAPSPMVMPSPKRRPLKRMGSDYKITSTQADSDDGKKSFRGYQKHSSGRGIWPIREATLEQLSPENNYEVDNPLLDELLKAPERYSWSGLDEMNDARQSGSSRLLSPQIQSPANEARKEMASKISSLFEGAVNRRKESLALELLKAEQPLLTAEELDSEKEISIYSEEEEGVELTIIEDALESQTDDLESSADHLKTPRDDPETPKPHHVRQMTDIPEWINQLIPVEKPIETQSLIQKPDKLEISSTPKMPECYLDRKQNFSLMELKDHNSLGSPANKHFRNQAMTAENNIFTAGDCEKIGLFVTPKVDWSLLNQGQEQNVPKRSIPISTMSYIGVNIRDVKEEYRLPVVTQDRVRIRLASPDPSSRQPELSLLRRTSVTLNPPAYHDATTQSLQHLTSTSQQY